MIRTQREYVQSKGVVAPTTLPHRSKHHHDAQTEEQTINPTSSQERGCHEEKRGKHSQ